MLQRPKEMSFDEYKAKRTQENNERKDHLKGRLIHLSKKLIVVMNPITKQPEVKVSSEKGITFKRPQATGETK